MTLYVTCSTSVSNNSEAELEDIFGGESICKDNPSCVDNCQELFARSSSLADRCGELSVRDVRNMKRIVLAMERGQWDSIEVDELEVIVDFDIGFWLEHVGISKESARNMLVWVAEETEIAELLDDEGEVLKRAFEEIGEAYEDNAVIEGMKDRIDRIDNRNFFELAAINDNEDAFTNAHHLLKEECDEDRVCMKGVYCSSCADIIFGQLNRLDLGDDVDRDGLLHKTECSECQ